MIEEALEKPSEGASVATAARGGTVFIAVSLVQRGLPFLLLPAFAAYLTAGEFGQIAYLTAIVGLLGALLGFGLEPWVIRTFVQLRQDDEERTRFVNTIGWFALGAPFAGGLAAALIYLLLLGNPGELPSTPIAALAFASAAVQTTSLVFTGAVLRAQGRLSAYAAVSVLQGAGGPLLALILIAVFGLGVFGWFAASLVAAAAALMLGLALLRHRWTLVVRPDLLRAALIFGLPLLPHALAHWALNLSDRIVLTSSRGVDEAGVYNVAYQLAAPIGLILVALRQGSMPLYALAHDDARLRRELGLLSTLQAHLAGLLGLGAALLGPLALGLAFPDTYQRGAGVLPWIALGYVLFGLYLIPADSMSLLLGRTRWLWLPTFVAAAANVTLNLLLIPRFGMTAAGVNTAIAYGILLCGVIVVRNLQGGPRIGYDVRRMGIGLGVCAGLGTAGLAFTSTWQTLEATLARVALILVAGAVVWIYDRSWWRAMHNRVPAVA